MKSLFLTAAMCVLPLSAATAQTCSKQSPAHTVALLELYTSEGCSSCPPADKFVGGVHRALSIDQVVPLALHVDYWDYIGWKDGFAKREFTERQRWLSNAGGSHTVYTPEMFVAGQELRNWSGGLPATVKRINERPAQADIGIALGKLAGNSLAVEVSATMIKNALHNAAQNDGQSQSAPPRGKLFVALYENGLTSAVKAGENGGATLKHDYVVREWIGPVALGGNGKAQLSRTLTVPPGAVGGNLGVAAFIEGDKGEVLQALALPLCGA
jgi:hypothetical protein